jgi:hypothetical protein
MTLSESEVDDGLSPGDRVRLKSESLGWRAEIKLRGKVGELTERRNDGRVTVCFDNGKLLVGRDPKGFERVEESGLKAKKS